MYSNPVGEGTTKSTCICTQQQSMCNWYILYLIVYCDLQVGCQSK